MRRVAAQPYPNPFYRTFYESELYPMNTATESALSAAHKLIHSNVHWRFEVPRGHLDLDSRPLSITANFTSAEATRDGETFLRGKVVDEYGWWHTGLVFSMDRLPEGMERVGYMPPDDAPFSVGMRFEWRHGLLRLVVPNDVALRLNAWRKEHWHEIPGVGDGYSDNARRGTWAHRTLAYLHSVQCHTTDDMPFIEGESFMVDGNRDYDLLVTTSGVRCTFPTVGYHFSG